MRTVYHATLVVVSFCCEKIPGNSEPGRELEVSLEGTSLEISCNLCLENFYKAGESAE